MSKISNLYTSTDNIYQTGGKRSSTKGLNGDVKHIVFKDGKPAYTEVIQVSKDPEKIPRNVKENSSSQRRSGRRIIASNRTSEEARVEKKKKLSDRLRKAMAGSETLWNEKNGLWISYQGNQQFLLKRYSGSNQLLDKSVMSSQEIIDSDIPGILDAGWKRL